MGPVRQNSTTQHNAHLSPIGQTGL